MIHAWLDGQLPVDEAARVEQLAASDAEWAAAVAEARGLVAASSRILSALDHVPAGVVPAHSAMRATRRLPWWTKAAAAVVLVAGGGVLVMQQASAPTFAPMPAVVVAAKTVGASSTPLATPSRAEPPAVQTPAPAPVQRAAAVERQRALEALPQRAADAPRAVEQDRAIMRQAENAVPRQDVADVSSQRVATTAVAAKAFAVGATPAAAPAAAPGAPDVAAAAPPSPVDTRVQGGVRSTGLVTQAHACFRLTDRRTQAELPRLMRSMRNDRDTLRLEVAQGTSPLRAWLVWSDGIARGMLATEPDGRGIIPVTATLAICPPP